ncbi:MAG TPA: right-handed parallel beta-helix repeat-containing protein [Promineifilum sp.]|nr:right-handed parallel beta-helix repeat-containing protein [Promineifilum sp.]
MNHHFIGTRRAIVALCLGLLVVALGTLTASAAAITVTPGSPQGWASTGNSGGGSSAITTTAPRSGLGSTELTGDRTRWIKAVDPLAPAKLGDLYAVTDFAFDWMVATGSTSSLPQPPDQTPGLRLHVYDPNATNKYSELIWEGAYNGPVTVTQGSWVSTDMIGGGQLLWRWVTGPGITLDGGGSQVNQTLSAWQNSAWYSSDAVVFGVSVGVGSSIGAGYHAFTDNVVLGFSNAPDTYNFEPNPVCTTVCYADAVNGNDANGGTSVADAKKTIQAAIDAVSAGGQVRVLPGSYSETATNRWVLGINGPHQFGLFVEDNTKDGISILGVTAADVEITDPSMTLADITTNATNNFGYSGIFVEADNVTISGLEIGANTPWDNKTIEVIGDAFTFKNSFMNVAAGGSLYFGDWRFDTGTNTSYMLSYEIDNNIFSDGTSVDITSGAGYSGATAGKKITNNEFEFSLAQYTASGNYSWPYVSFTGDSTTVPWFVYPMTGAVITGNTFNNTAPNGIHIRARGIADDSTFDWESYWNDNTFNKAVIVGPTLFSDVRSYNYACSGYSCNDVRQIGAVIQPEVDHAVAGDTVLVNEGTYPEQVVIPTSLTLEGEDGKALTFITAPATMPPAANPDSTIVKIFGAGVSVEMFGFTVTGPGPTGCGSILAGIFVRDGAYANIHDNTISDVRDTGLSGCQNGIGIYVGRQSLSTTGTADITNNTIKTYQKAGIVVDNTGSQADITGNTIQGDGPIAYIAENGVQVSRGATAEINNNTISGHSYSPFSWVATGIYVWAAGPTNTDGNTISENQVGVYIVDTDGTHKNNTISATSTGTGSPGFWGMIVDAPPPTHVPQPVDGDAVAAPSVGPNSPAPEQTVLVTGNNFTSDNSAGGVGLEADAGFGSYDIDLTATKNIIHNWEYGVYVLECSSGCTGTDFANVAINRNSIVGNTEYGMLADTLTPVTDGTCNWWGDASGPSEEGPGTGDKVGVDIDYTPWLYSDDLDGPCFIGGTIKVTKVAAGGGNTQFGFDPSWSTTNFSLTDGGSQTSPMLPAGSYSVAEVTPLPTYWVLDSATCDNTTTTPVETTDPSAITVADGDAWVCTFTNVYSPPTNVCSVDASSNLWTDIIGKGMGNGKKHKAQMKLTIPNYTAVNSLYGQMVAKNNGHANYVRFVMPGKNNFVQVNAITSPAAQQAGNFWYGDYIPAAKLPTKSVTGRWYLQSSGTKNHIPRALVLYPTYADPVNTWVNIWNTYDAAEAEVYWDTALGWTPTQVITESIAPPNGPTTFNVELALVDNDKDARPVWVTVEAGGVTQTQKPNNPSDGEQLNLMTFTLDVPEGTDMITITVYSPSAALDDVIGDSAALVGMRANYMCAPLN